MTDSPSETVLQQIAGVRFTKVGKLYHFDFSEYPDLKAGDFVIVETVRGRQMGQIMGFIHAEENRDYRSIMRPATARDLALRQEWEAQQPEALTLCQEKARKIRGYNRCDFVAAQYNYDGSAITFLFTSDDKVDTGKLQRALDKEMDAAVDIRQVGPRDVAKLMGGFGACGIERCCSTFLTDFSPISIKMAKTQGISLNPSEIHGHVRSLALLPRLRIRAVCRSAQAVTAP